jgi:uncharacterized protein with WD repeat
MEDNKEPIPDLRESDGKFKKGVSGNPGGRTQNAKELAKIAREYTDEAIQTIVKVMRTADKEKDRTDAADKLLDRGWGKAPQEVKLSGDTENPLQILVDRATKETAEEWLKRRAND